jgi:hypothetical protein
VDLDALPQRLGSLRTPLMSFRSAQLIRKGFNSAFSMVLQLGNKQASSSAESPSQQVDAPSDAAIASHECRVA